MKILTVLDLNKNEIRNVVFQTLATPPDDPREGQFYYNSVSKKLFMYNGTSWTDVGSAYVLPPATEAVLGGIKKGNGVSVSSDGTLSTDIQEIRVNDVKAAPSIGVVNIEVPVVDCGDKYLELENLDNKVIIKNASAGYGMDFESYANDVLQSTVNIPSKEYVDSVAVGALKPAGSVAFANLPALTAANLNKMYNVTDAFTTTADFVEGAGKDYPAGTNVAIINTGTEQAPVYKYDAMTGLVDLSAYPTRTEVNGLFTVSTATITTTETTKTVAYTGKLLECYATMSGEKVIVDTEISNANVKFTCAQAPSTPITCIVVSANALT